MTTITMRGYEIKSWYEGITAFAAYKDGKEVYRGWCLEELINAVGFNPYA